jgi:2-polyprenyl-3-methyl-5-hydroxy-6-metoxy-1,4-benzoquinol methylase
MARLKYLWRSILRQLQSERFKCPNCESTQSTIVSRKYIVTALRRCANCKLMYRTPSDDPSRNAAFYESEYSQGFTTDLPSDDALSSLIAQNFAGTDRSWAYYNGILTRLGLQPGARVFDFGCSWGYGSFQMSKAGYEVKAFEIAATRKRYAQQKLAIDMVENMETAVADPRLAGTFDCFFTAHVIEHLPVPSKVFEYANALLRPAGLFVAFVPNGATETRAAHPEWNSWWGEVHPNLIDPIFLDQLFAGFPRVYGAHADGPIDIPADPGEARYLDGLVGPELFFASRKVSSIDSRSASTET